MMGPKKFVGKKPNQQIHLHTSKKINYTDFDTFSRVMSSKNNVSSQLTASASQSKYMRSVKSNFVKRSEENSPETNKDIYAMKDSTHYRNTGGILSE